MAAQTRTQISRITVEEGGGGFRIRAESTWATLFYSFSERAYFLSKCPMAHANSLGANGCDAELMRHAIRLARIALERGDTPVGSVVRGGSPLCSIMWR